MKWKHIETAPRDGTKFLGWVNDDWIEGFRIEDGIAFYASDGDAPRQDKGEPKFWLPWPNSPETDT